jgi:hypothetical protein
VRKVISMVGALVIVLCAISTWADSFTATNSMTSARGYHAATLLPHGKVLIADGMTGAGAINSAEIYNPTKGPLR